MTHRQIAEAVAAMGGVTVTALGLRFDCVAVRVLDRLERGADAGPHPGASVALTLTAPIRAPGKTAGALQQEINALLRTGVRGTGGGSNYTGTGRAASRHAHVGAAPQPARLRAQPRRRCGDDPGPCGTVAMLRRVDVVLLEQGSCPDWARPRRSWLAALRPIRAIRPVRCSTRNLLSVQERR